MAATNIKMALICDIGKRVKQSEIKLLSDGVYALLERTFPLYSGSFVSIFPVDDNGDPIKKKPREKKHHAAKLTASLVENQ